MRGKYAETFPTSCAIKGKTKQKKIGELLAVPRGGGGDITQFNMGKGYRLIDMYIHIF